MLVLKLDSGIHLAIHLCPTYLFMVLPSTDKLGLVRTIQSAVFYLLHCYSVTPPKWLAWDSQAAFHPGTDRNETSIVSAISNIVCFQSIIQELLR